MFLTQPSIHILTDCFHGIIESKFQFQSSKTQLLLMKNSSSLQEYWYMHDSHHFMQADPFVLLGLEINLLFILSVTFKGQARLPNFANPADVYMSFNYKLTDFMRRQNLLPDIADVLKLDESLKTSVEWFYKVDWEKEEVQEMGNLLRINN